MKNLYDYERTQSATTDLPFGALKNESSPGKQDGTDIVAEHIQDLAYSLYQVLQLAGINPNGELEDGNNKTQFIESLTNIGVFRYSDKTSYNYGVFAWQVIGNTFTLYRSLKNSNSDDVNNNESWLKILEIGADNKINFNVDTNILGLSANPSLSNLSEAGEDRLNVAKMYETGAVSNDTKGFKELLKRAHSTFDLSKFEVVGSPSITDDGVASGFSDSNIISINDLSITNKWSLEFNITIYSLSLPINPILQGSIYNRIFIQSNGNIRIFANQSDNQEGFLDFNTNFVFNKLYNIKISYNGIDTYTIVSTNLEDGTIYKQNIVKNIVIAPTITKWNIGSDTNRYLDGSIDLKSFSIWADGIPVFNGNKTGLFVAKPDNYEIVGSPTITEDGIASGFSQSNNIRFNFSNNNVENINIFGAFNIKDINSSIVLLGTSNAEEGCGIWYNGTSKTLSIRLRSNLSQDAGDWDIDNSNYTFTPSIGKNTFSFVQTNDKYYFNIYNANGDNILNKEIQSTKNLKLSNVLIGAVWGNTPQSESNSIDLNTYKFYSNDNLIYQPCLKIPYTEADSTSRIVDVAYRGRVKDLYEQTGEALFYTIDEQNQNFSLPAGDIYGMITKNREILDIVYPIGRPMPEENNVLLDNEVWLEGATVNPVDYPKLFKVYGTKYGGDGTTTFKLPDMRGRTLWGSSDGSNGYIEAKLPNIKGAFFADCGGQGASANGAFAVDAGYTMHGRGTDNSPHATYSINASRSNSIYSDDATTVQPPAFKVRWKTRFE